MAPGPRPQGAAEVLKVKIVRERKARPPIYGEDVIVALRFCWAVMGTASGKRLVDLATLDGQERTPLTPETHAQCPGRAAWINHGWQGVAAIYVCTDPKVNGHVDRYGTSTSTQAGAPKSEDEKAERRAVLANNKAWRSAETVRREWLTTFAARKTAPKDAAAFVASRIAAGTGRLDKASTQTQHRLARTLLGLPEPAGYDQRGDLVDLVAKASPAWAQHIALVLILAAIEDNTAVHTWRHRTAEDAAYFTALASWGYGLSQVETLLTTATEDTDEDQVEDDVEDYDDDTE